MKTGIIIQARMGSTRLPGKVMLPVLNKPILQHMIERLSNCERLNITEATIENDKRKYIKVVKEKIKVIIATTPNSKEIIELCEKCNIDYIDYFVGCESDVLQRVYKTAKFYGLDIIVDLTSDCPFVDPSQIIVMVNALESCGFDYVCNIFPRTWPDGFDIQIYTFDVLEQLNKTVTGPNREHTGYNVISSGLIDKLEHFNLPATCDYEFPDMRLTLDTQNDYENIKFIYENLSDVNSKNAEQIIDFVKQNPKLFYNTICDSFTSLHRCKGE